VDVTKAATDEETFGSWLARHGQSPRAVEALWSLITVATLNISPDEASLALAAMVFQTGLFGDAAAADIGLPGAPLGLLHGHAGAVALAAAGVDVRLGARVHSLVTGPTGGPVVHTDDGGLEADAVILAVPHDVAAGLLPPGSTGAEALRMSPIINAHVVFDRRVLAEPFAALLGGDLQWVFDRTATSGLPSGQYLAASISAADALIGLRTHELRERLLPQFVAAFPAAASAQVLDFFVTREPAATFRQAAGTAKLRPGPVTATPGVYLAGAWTATGWPATMEGAVRSGTMAATAALAERAAHDSPSDPEGARA
jgi:squalene-associated FAD-dependent desaturase